MPRETECTFFLPFCLIQYEIKTQSLSFQRCTSLVRPFCSSQGWNRASSCLPSAIIALACFLCYSKHFACCNTRKLTLSWHSMHRFRVVTALCSGPVFLKSWLPTCWIHRDQLLVPASGPKIVLTHFGWTITNQIENTVDIHQETKVVFPWELGKMKFISPAWIFMRLTCLEPLSLHMVTIATLGYSMNTMGRNERSRCWECWTRTIPIRTIMSIQIFTERMPLQLSNSHRRPTLPTFIAIVAALLCKTLRMATYGTSSVTHQMVDQINHQQKTSCLNTPTMQPWDW